MLLGQPAIECRQCKDPVARSHHVGKALRSGRREVGDGFALGGSDGNDEWIGRRARESARGNAFVASGDNDDITRFPRSFDCVCERVNLVGLHARCDVRQVDNPHVQAFALAVLGNPVKCRNYLRDIDGTGIVCHLK